MCSNKSEQPSYVTHFEFVQPVYDPVGITQGCRWVCRGNADDLHFRCARGFNANVRILKDEAPICRETKPFGA